jgi:hypothetical protein
MGAVGDAAVVGGIGEIREGVMRNESEEGCTRGERKHTGNSESFNV